MTKLWPNCAFYDTSITFGTKNLEYIITKYMDIGPSRILSWKALAAILKMAAENQFPLSKDFCNVDQTLFEQKHTTSGPVISNVLHLTFYDIQIRDF